MFLIKFLNYIELRQYDNEKYYSLEGNVLRHTIFL